MPEKKRVAVLFGGHSSEYGVSLQSAASVLEEIDRERFVPISIGISRQGDWYLYEGPIQAIREDAWQRGVGCAPVAFSPSRGGPALVSFAQGLAQRIAIDAAFPVLHGKDGEDGTVQGLFALVGVPVVGCGVLASALCMDKARAHKLVQAEGIRVPRSFSHQRPYCVREIVQEADGLGYPLFVKPVRSGSSYGVSRVETAQDLLPAVERAFAHDDTVLLEEAIPGREVGCAVLGNGALTLGEVDEIELQGGFFDFSEKYTLKTARIHVPARLSASAADRVKAVAARVYRILACQGFARVDLFYTPEGEIVFHEVNTIPGFTGHSRFPRMMQAAGWSLKQVLTAAIDLALGGGADCGEV